jgi:hypothetical protein
MFHLPGIGRKKHFEQSRYANRESHFYLGVPPIAAPQNIERHCERKARSNLCHAEFIEARSKGVGLSVTSPPSVAEAF